MQKTYDIYFVDSEGGAVNKGFKKSENYCMRYILNNLYSLKTLYEGNICIIVCNEDCKTYLQINL